MLDAKPILIVSLAKNVPLVFAFLDAIPAKTALLTLNA